MPLNDHDWRPITFQGVEFPPTLMAISILEPVLEFEDDEFGEWLWRFPICCGVTNHAPADQCAKFARKAADLMLEQRQRVLDGVRDRLVSHGFDPETTFRDWILALQRIRELSAAAQGECAWSAPAHPSDHYKTAANAELLIDALERARPRSKPKA
jgi:hypothetical protein